MKTIIDLRKISDLNCGLGQVALHLNKSIETLTLKEFKNNNITYYCPKNVQKKGSPLIKGKTFYYHKWHRSPFFFRPDCDVWHAIHQDVKVFPTSQKIRKILTIHDLNAIHEEKREEKIASYLKQLQRKINRAHTVTFISQFTQKEVAQYLDLSRVNQQVIMNGAALNHNLESARPKKLPHQINRFFFSIGTVVPKKNFKLILEIAKALPNESFVIAGTTFHHYAKELAHELKLAGLQERVILLGEITEAEKLFLYDHAQALIHPSFLEGFGLPIIEAFSRGLPVISSRAGSLPEVCGDLGYLFDPNSPKEAIEKIKEFQQSPTTIEHKNDLVHYAEGFSWEKAARAYLTLYEQVQEKRSS